jgi:cell division control protein 24
MSIIPTVGLQIDMNASSNLLNKAASQSTSLYQQCSSLKSRLMRIRGFPPYFSLASPEDSRQSTDPVTQLWDLFSLGTPLCYIFDQLPVDACVDKIDNSEFNQGKYAANPDRAKKHAIALFAMKIRKDEVMQAIPGCEPFTVTDLWDRNSTDGFVKVSSFNLCYKLAHAFNARLLTLSPPSSTTYHQIHSRTNPLLLPLSQLAPLLIHWPIRLPHFPPPVRIQNATMLSRKSWIQNVNMFRISR